MEDIEGTTERQPKSRNDLLALIEGYVRNYYGHNPVVEVQQFAPGHLRIRVGGKDERTGPRYFRIRVSEER